MLGGEGMNGYVVTDDLHRNIVNVQLRIRLSTLCKI